MALSTSAHRVPDHTRESINERIRRETAARVHFYADHPDQIENRLDELDREWDTERLLETNAATLALAGTLLGVAVNRRFLLLPLAVAAFLLQHGVQGWCPPLPVLRRMGVRTPREIEAERYALMALRGDFDDLPENRPDRAEASFARVDRSRPRHSPARARSGRP